MWISVPLRSLQISDNSMNSIESYACSPADQPGAPRVSQGTVHGVKWRGTI